MIHLLMKCHQVNCLQMVIWILFNKNLPRIENQQEIQELEKKFIMNFWKLKLKNYKMK